MKAVRNALIGLVAVSALLVSTAGLAKKPSERVTVYDAAQTVQALNGEFAVLNLALSLNPAIEAVLDGNGQFTVFAPTNAAFESLAETIAAPGLCYGSILELAVTQSEYLTDVLLYHVARGRMDSTEVLPKDRIRMLSGDFVTRIPGSLVLTDQEMRDSLIETPDVFTDNGVIHVISEVLLPYLPPSNCE